MKYYWYTFENTDQLKPEHDNTNRSALKFRDRVVDGKNTWLG